MSVMIPELNETTETPGALDREHKSILAEVAGDRRGSPATIS